MERNYAIDYIKFFAIVFIVCIHTTPFKGVEESWFNGDQANVIINTVARFGVPFFFVTSGYLFVQKLSTQKDPKRYFIKFTKKLIILYFSWLFFYWIFDSLILVIDSLRLGLDMKKEFISYIKQNFSLICTFYYGIGSRTSYQLWFLPALIWSIIILYISFKYKKLKLLLNIGLAFNILGLFGQMYSGIFALPLITRDTLFYGLFYTTLGGYFAFYHDVLIKKLMNIYTLHLILFF